MKLSKNLRLEIKIHLVFFAGAWVGAPIMYVAYQMGYFDPAPPEFVVCFGIFMAILLYAWWRQCLSADKTQIIPRIW
jgi:hypothetical protein